MTTPVVVVGAGVLGLSTALELLRRGDRPVVVLDTGDLGGGTTPAGAGFVASWATVLPHLGASGLALVRHSLDFYNSIAADGVDIAHRANGNIVFFNHADSFAAGTGAIMSGPHITADTRVVSASEISEMSSGVVNRDEIAGGVFMPDGIQLDTGPMLRHLAELVSAAGGEIRARSRVTAIVHDRGRIVGLEVTGSDGSHSQQLETDCVVLATGAWLNDRLADVGWTLPLLPFVATRFVTADVDLPPTMPTMQGKDFPLWIRESGGGFTWGSTPGAAPAHRLDQRWREPRGAEPAYPELVDDMQGDVERIATVFPSLLDAETTTVIQGMPVYTVDRQFFLGEVPGCAGLWAMGGDNESGVSHGPGMGRLMTDLVLGDEPMCDPTPYRLDRFSPTDFPDAESVGQHLAAQGPSFIADAMQAPKPSGPPG